MKRLFKYAFIPLLLLSLSLNALFFIRWKNRHDKEKAEMDMKFAKSISYKDGYASLKERLQEEQPEMLANKKMMLIYFWDSLFFDETHSRAMPEMDSLAETLGKSRINYLFMTEMDRDATEQFMERQNLHFKNFLNLYEMNDFMSSLYIEKGPKWKKIGSKDTSGLHMMRIMKLKPAYFIIDETGKILFSGFRFIRPARDTAFLSALKKYCSNKSIRIMN